MQIEDYFLPYVLPDVSVPKVLLSSVPECQVSPAFFFFFENSRTGEHKSAMSACKYSNYTRSAVNITRSRGENTKVRKACTDAWMYRKIYLVFACFVAIF